MINSTEKQKKHTSAKITLWLNLSQPENMFRGKGSQVDIALFWEITRQKSWE